MEQNDLQPLMGDVVATVGTQPATDTWTVRMVVAALGLVSLAIVIGSIVLASNGSDPLPDSIQTLGATCVGALGALLASTRSMFTKNGGSS